MRDVAFSCDDRGVDYLLVAVGSLLAHYRGTDALRVNVFEGFGGHSAENHRRLEALVARFPDARLRYVDAEPAVEPYRDLILSRAGSRWNVFTWTPVFTPQLLADAAGNVVHFDIDMLFNDDISPLLEMDLGDDLIACVHEYHRGAADGGRVIWEKGILPASVERYFNTGVIVFNTAKCVAERTWAHVVEWYRAHYGIADRIEQDAWNALYHGRMRALPVRWNFHDRALKRYARWDVRDCYWLGNPPKECLEAALNPAILHFWGPKKPWKPSHRPYRKLYHAAMRQVGQEPPREERLAFWHDFVNARRLGAIRRRLAQLSTETAKPQGDSQ